MGDWLVGILCSGLVAWVAWRKQSLSVSGAISALIVGTILYAVGSLAWFGSMIFFFVSSSLLTRWKHRAKARIEATYEKSGRRDAGQVVANGGMATLFCIAYAWTNEPYWLYLFVGVMATVTADTWATEIGGLSSQKPLSILSGKRVEPGTSGGITAIGLLASAAGGLLIGTVFWLFVRIRTDQWIMQAGDGWQWIVAGLLGGLLGSLTDSLLGAAWQRKNKCIVCGKEMEASFHCGQATRHSRGIRWLGNDAVNMISSAVGGVAVFLLMNGWN